MSMYLSHQICNQRIYNFCFRYYQCTCYVLFIEQKAHLNRFETCNFRSTTPLPSTDTEGTTLRESSETPKEEATTTRETSTRSTLTTPFREPRVLSKLRLEPKIEKIRIKPTAKVRTVLASKNVGRLTTTRSRETTILPTSSFRTRGNMHKLAV